MDAVRPVTDAFKAAIAQSHRVATRVEILADGAVVRTIDTVTAGTVTLDANAQARGRLDLTLVDDGTLVPSVPADLLAPYGRELRVSRGVEYPDGTQELVPLAVCRIDDVDVDQLPVIHITGQDRSARITDARFEEPYEVAQGTNVATAILNLVQGAYPDVTYSFTTTMHNTGHMVAEEGGDRWKLAQDFATNAGLRLYFDGDGTLVLAPESAGAAVVNLVEGDDGVLLTAAKRWTRTGTYNRAIAVGENMNEIAPVRGVATDENPLSPTFYGGSFGRVPVFMQSQFIVTADQALDAATAALARQLGTTQAVNFGSLVLPHLEPGDVARITRQAAMIDQDSIIDQLTIPLGAEGTMTGSMRATQVTA